MRLYKLLVLLIFKMAFFAQCSFIADILSKKRGVVYFYNSIPSRCTTSRGLKQKLIKPVYSETEMLNHYGISFKIRFQDKISPSLYGVLYHQDKDKNIYCMALPDGRFALFSNSLIENKKNIIQEICYPLKKCNREF